MSSEFHLFRLSAMPAVWRPASLYFIKGHNGPFAEAYITDLDGNPFPFGNSDMINELIEQFDIYTQDPGDVTLWFENALVGPP